MTVGDGRPRDPAPKRLLRSVGTGLGCLFLLVGSAVLVLIALAYFFEQPALGVAVVALVVATASYRSRGRRS